VVEDAANRLVRVRRLKPRSNG